MDYTNFYKKYKSRTDDEIRSYLDRIKLVYKTPGGFVEFGNEIINKIKAKPRNVSQNFSEEEHGNEIDLIEFKTIKFLVKSSSRFFLKADIGEVFDQMSDDDIAETDAILTNDCYLGPIDTEGEHFIMKATLLRLKLNKPKSIEDIEVIL